MAFGGFDHGKDAPMAEMNVIPLVDIMLVLLVIFIITAPVITHKVTVELPKASSEASEADAQTLLLEIAADGGLHLDEQSVSLEQLQQQLAQLSKDAPQSDVHLFADRRVDYEHVARAMAAVRSAGITQLGFVTEPQE